MGIVGMIKGHQLFRSLSFEEIEEISAFSGPKRYEAEEAVFERGRTGGHFFIVLDGCVNLMLPAKGNEHSMVIAHLEKDEIFGLSPLLGGGKYTTLALCTEPTTVLAIEVAPFRAIIEENSRVGLNIMNEIARAYFTRYVDTLEHFRTVMAELTLR